MNKRILTKQFTLLEVLVASCIIGIFLGVVLNGFSVTMKDSEIAADYITAAQLAEIKFNDIMIKKELKESDDSGIAGETGREFQWRTLIKKHGEKKEFSVNVEVSFGKGDAKRVISLKSFIIFSEKAAGTKKEDEGKTVNTNSQT